MSVAGVPFFLLESANHKKCIFLFFTFRWENYTWCFVKVCAENSNDESPPPPLAHRQRAVLPAGGRELVGRQRPDPGPLLRLSHRLVGADAAQPAGKVLRVVRAVAPRHCGPRRRLPQPGGTAQGGSGWLRTARVVL